MKTLYKWSVEDYHRIIESGVLDEKSVELLEGEIITVSPEKPIHSSRIDTVADYCCIIFQAYVSQDVTSVIQIYILTSSLHVH